MPLEQRHIRDIRKAIARLDEHDQLHTPSKVKPHPLAPEPGPNGEVYAALDHSGYNYLHEGPDDRCPVCRATVIRKEVREILQGLLP